MSEQEVNAKPHSTAQALQEHLAQARRVQARIKQVGKKLTALDRKHRELEAMLRGVVAMTESFRQLDILERPVSEAIAQAHRLVMEATAEKLRDDITIARERELTQTVIPGRIVALRAICTHTLVLDFMGYGGSHSDDYEDQYPAERRCALCNLRETSSGSNARQEVYTILVDTDDRLMIRKGRYSATDREVVWQSLDAVHLQFRTSLAWSLKKAQNWLAT